MEYVSIIIVATHEFCASNNNIDTNAHFVIWTNLCYNFCHTLLSHKFELEITKIKNIQIITFCYGKMYHLLQLLQYIK
jgi:hypothetical protein